MLYQYKAIKSNGSKVKDIIDAENLEEAKYLISKQNVILIKIQAICNKDIQLKKEDLLFFTKELLKLIKASLPLYESLIALAQRYEKKKIRFLLLDLCSKLQKGYSLSEALKTYGKSFDIIYCSMIENAERSGDLESTLEEIVKTLEKNNSLKRKLISSFSYPLILSCFCFFILIALFFFIIPSLFELFEEKNLHPFTKIVLNISFFANSFKNVLLTIFLLAIGLFSATWHIVFFRKKIVRVILKVPFLKTLFIKIALVRFFRSFSSLLMGGVSFISAFSLSIKVMNHLPLEEKLESLKERLSEGYKLSELLKSIKEIPLLVIRMLSIAEEASGLANMQKNIAIIYEDEIEKSLSKITTLLQPVMLIILGIIVGFVVLSVLLPLTDVGSFMGS